MALTRYDFEDKLISALRNRAGVATVGDLSSDTGLAYEEVEGGLKRLLGIYKSHLDVDEDGNLLYQFDERFIRRGDDKKHLWHTFKKKAWAVFKVMFKFWILAMLIGYVSVFVILLIALAVGAIGAASSTDSDGALGDLIFIPFHLLARLLEFMFWIDFYGASGGLRPKRKKKKVSKPFYQKTFDFVFGPEKETDPLGAHKTFTQFVRSNDGQITAADWAKVSGQSLEEAGTALTASVLRFNGEVDFTENGTLIYKFAELLLSAKDKPSYVVTPSPALYWERIIKLPLLTGNPKSTNRWIFGLNIFILIASIIVLTSYSVMPLIRIGLGIVPLSFSFVFFMVPLFRWIKQKRLEKNVAIEKERKIQVKKVFSSAQDGTTIKVSNNLVLDFDGLQNEKGFTFPTLADQLNDGLEARRAETLAETFGVSIFSSDENSKSVSDYDMEDFDRRLEEELGAQVFEDVHVQVS